MFIRFLYDEHIGNWLKFYGVTHEISSFEIVNYEGKSIKIDPSLAILGIVYTIN